MLYFQQSVFKSKHTFEEREREGIRLNIKYNDKIPIILEVNSNYKDELCLDKNKYLVPYDLTISQFVYVIRKRLKLLDSKSIFIFFNGKCPASSELIQMIYNENKDKDGFLYATITSENTFGV